MRGTLDKKSRTINQHHYVVREREREEYIVAVGMNDSTVVIMCCSAMLNINIHTNYCE